MTFATLVAAALCAFTPPNMDEVGGPLRLRNEFPFQMIFLSTPPLDARIPKRKRLEVELKALNTIAPDQVIDTNAGAQMVAASQAGNPQPIDFGAVLAESATRPGRTFYIADTETWKLGFVYSHPFGERWLLEVDAPIYAHGAGFLDPIIKGWHNAFGFPYDGRPLVPESESQVGFARDGRGISFGGQQGPGIGDITVRGLYNAVAQRDWWPTTSISAALKLPTGDVSSLFGSGTWDGGLGLHVTRQYGQSWLYGTLGYNFHGGWRGMSQVPVRNSFDAHLGYEYRVSSEWSVVGGLSYYGSPIEASEAKSVNNPATNYGLAARFSDGKRFELEWGFVENLFRNNNTYDFGLYSRVRFWP